MPYIFGKLWHLAIIWAIRKAFQCILKGVRILLAKHTRISPTSENDSYPNKKLYMSRRVQHIPTLWGRGLRLDCPFSTKTLSMLWPSMDKSRDWGIKDRHTKRVCHTARGAYCVMITGNEIGKTRTLEPVGVLCMNFKRTSSTISLLLFLSRFLTVTPLTCVWDFSLHWYITRMFDCEHISESTKSMLCILCILCASWV